jgi:hydroxymethylpyrimidine/phosphomethylpyrimidine kinase
MKTFWNPGAARRPLCWSIAGFDGGGGAGLLADLDTFSRLKASGRAALTAVTAQGPSGVRHLQPVGARNLLRQLDCLLEQGTPQAVKIGMLARAELVDALAGWLERNLYPGIPRVLDPVLEASAGGRLLEKSALDILRRRLVPLATVITPNLAEARALLGIRTGRPARARLARQLLDLGCPAVVITGGDGRGPVRDILAQGQKVRIFSSTRLPLTAHGTGCRFSSALAVGLGRGLPLPRAVRRAGEFVRLYLLGEFYSRTRSQ